jgi:hypothetical protein
MVLYGVPYELKLTPTRIDLHTRARLRVRTCVHVCVRASTCACKCGCANVVQRERCTARLGLTRRGKPGPNIIRPRKSGSLAIAA